MTILWVEDQDMERVEDFCRSEFYCEALDKWYIDVALFDKAHEAIRWIRSGCYIENGKTVFERRPESYPSPPDIAFLDIDFVGAIEFDKVDASPWGDDFPLSAMSAHVGWSIASVLRDIPKCTTYFVTGNTLLVAALAEAGKAHTCDHELIEPFLGLLAKGERPKMYSAVLQYIEEKSERLLEGGAFDRASCEWFIAHFSILADNSVYDDLVRTNYPQWYPRYVHLLQGERLRAWAIENGKPFLSLFPSQFKVIADFSKAMSKSRRREAVDHVLSRARQVDRNSSLWRCLKRVVGIDDQNRFLTPAAAVKHDHVWDYVPGSDVTVQDGRLLSLSDPAVQRDQEERFRNWYSGDRGQAEIHEALRRRADDSGVGAYMWFRQLEQQPARLCEWESTVSYWVEKLLAGTWVAPDGKKLEVIVGDLPNDHYVTHWRAMFDGSASAFGLFMTESASAGAARVDISSKGTSDILELVFAVKRKDGKHIGSSRGIKRPTYQRSLEGWGTSWLEMSELQSPRHSDAIVYKQPLWPKGAIVPLERLGSAGTPIIELHWIIKNYLLWRL